MKRKKKSFAISCDGKENRKSLKLKDNLFVAAVIAVFSRGTYITL